MATSRQKALAIIPKCTGLLSLLGSAFIFQDVVRSRKKRGKVYHRIMIGLSSFDMMASIVNILSTWPIPRDTSNVYGAVGTTQTCTAQGFFNETGNVCTPLYNAALCTYYLLMIRYGWSEKRLKKVEKYFHIVPLFFGWTLGVLGLPFDLYNNSGWLCWIAPLPQDCRHSEEGCIRGEHAWIFRWVHYAVIWGAILFVTCGMFMIYRKVSTEENATARFTQHGNQRSRGKQTRKVARQAMLFVGALYLTWVFTTLTRIFQITEGKTYFPLLILMAIFFPLQGFFNAIIYLRPRYIRCRERHPELSIWQVIKKVATASGEEADRSDFSSAATKRLSLLRTVSVIKRRLTYTKAGREESSGFENDLREAPTLEIPNKSQLEQLYAESESSGKSIEGSDDGLDGRQAGQPKENKDSMNHVGKKKNVGWAQESKSLESSDAFQDNVP